MNRNIVLGQRWNKHDDFGGFRYCQLCGAAFKPHRGFQQPTPTICNKCKQKCLEEIK